MQRSIQQIVVPEKISKGMHFAVFISYAAQPTFSMPLSFEALGFDTAPAVGTLLIPLRGNSSAFAKVLSIDFQTENGPAQHARQVMYLEAQQDIFPGVHVVIPKRSGPALAWITLSDFCLQEKQADSCGPLIPQLLGNSISFSHCQGYLLPEAPHPLSALLMNLAVTQGYNLVITVGGTELSSKASAPEAILKLLDRRLPAFEDIIIQSVLRDPSAAVFPQAVAGCIGNCLILCLPETEQGMHAILTDIIPIVKHTLAALQGISGN